MVFILLFIVSFICLLIGLMVPAFFGRLTQGSRMKVGQIFGGALLILFILVGLIAPNKTDHFETSSLNMKTIEENRLNSMKENQSADPTIALATPTFTPTPTAFPTPIKVLLKPTSTPVPTVYIPPTNAPVQQTSIESFTCNCAKTCAQMSSCAEAQYQLNNCGCSARDADHDGTACDSQCQ